MNRTTTGRIGRLTRRWGALVVAVACAEQAPLPIEDLVRQGDAYLHPVTLEPYSGPAFAAYAGSPNRIERRATLRDGHYDGLFELYFENRRLSVREVYRHGQKDGPYEWYLESGELYERGTYVNGLREGPYEAHFAGGRIEEKGTYRYGDFDGPREWFLDGRLIERVTYVSGQIDGPYERFTTDGRLELRGTLRYGNPCGVWLEAGKSVVYPSCGYVSD